MASSSSSLQKYDVYINFRGKDTRRGFTSILHQQLRRNGISVFMDDRYFRSGHEMESVVMDAIKSSKISIIILSENYASSAWCLNELVKVLECREIYGQIVIPVFYGIEPSVVLKQEGSYADAFAKHEEHFKDEMEKVDQWRNALKYAANLSGFCSNQFRHEPELVGKIVKFILSQLHKYQSSIDIYEGLYGIQKRISKIEGLLSIGSTDVQIIGICGMGGIGKTTLASVIFQKIYPLFEACGFLENVREESAIHGVDHLRKKLLTRLLNDGAIPILDSPFVVSPFIGDRFRCTKVLIVLDDVDCSIDLEALIKGYEELPPGSRIIVTTRDRHVLNNVANGIYMVEGLDTSESLDLFHSYAFQKKHRANDYEMLSLEVAKYADGNPLALTVLGSSLHSRPIEEWKSVLKTLEMVPDNLIQSVLRISYEGLNDMERELFLDISCFFACSCRKFKRHEVESIVENDFSPELGISVLEEKSLVSIEDYQVIRMHNLLQQMGFAMVCDEDKEPGNRSRLWNHKDISHALETASGTAKIKSISLDLCDLEEDVKVSPAAFSKMSNLQYFQIINHENADLRLLLPDYEHGLEFCVSNKLRYFCWEFYPYKSFPSELIPENLVELILPNSQLVEFWNEDQPAPALEKLKLIDLHGCKNLTQIPNLSRAINIESICLAHCTSLVQVPSYFKDLHKLQFLNLTHCSNLIEVEGISAGKHLTELLLGGTAIREVPSSIACLSGLLKLDLHDCKRLKILPTSICKLKSLQSLNLSGCLNLEKLPEDINGLASLHTLSLSDCLKLEKLPDNLEQLKSMRKLYIQGSGLKRLPSSLFLMENLESVSCDEEMIESAVRENIINYHTTGRCFSVGWFCNSLTRLDLSDCNLSEPEAFPEYFGKLVRLQHLNLSRNPFSVLPHGINELSSLTTLRLEHCKRLRFLEPELLPSSLEVVEVNYCTSLGSFLDPLKPCHLRCTIVNCLDCTELVKRQDGKMTALTSLTRFLEDASKRRYRDFKFVVPQSDDELPSWFINQSLTASITLKLDPNWRNMECIGFAMVFCFPANSSSNDNLSCSIRLRGSIHRETTMEMGVIGSRMLDHLCLLYSPCEDTLGFIKQLEPSSFDTLEFSFLGACGPCGVRLVYDEDIEELKQIISKYNNDQKNVQSSHSQRDEWESALHTLRTPMEKEIFEKLKISYDALNGTDQRIFLDIACFFNGFEKDYVISIMDNCGFEPIIGIENLIDKSLLSIQHDGKLWMHHLLQEMGKEIVREESSNDVTKQSRIWNVDDLKCILENHKEETSRVEAIVTNLDGLTMDFKFDALSCMKKLRLLMISGFHPKIKYPSSEAIKFPSSFQPRKLVHLKLWYSSIEQLWDNVTEPLYNLKVIDLSFSLSFTKFEDFTVVPNLETLILQHCEKLSEIHPSIEHLKKLILLDLKFCTNLEKLPKEMYGLASLETLNLVGCSKLEKLPDNLEQLKNLRNLDIVGSGIEHGTEDLSSSIFLMENLESVYCDDEEMIESAIRENIISYRTTGKCFFPNSFCTSLTRLELIDCNLIGPEAFPEYLSTLVSLRYLDLSKNPFSALPPWFNGLPRLRIIRLEHCESLRCLEAELLPSRLEVVYVNYCTSLASFLDPLKPCHLRCSSVFCLDCTELVKRQDGKMTAHASLTRFLEDPSERRDLDFKFVIPQSDNELPSWFINQSPSTSITIKADPNKSNLDLIGIAMVFCFRTNSSTEENLSCNIRVSGSKNWETTMEVGVIGSRISDHIFLLYSPCEDTLEFIKQLGPQSYDALEFSFLCDEDCSSCGPCGVRLVYEEDIEELKQITTQSISQLSKLRYMGPFGPLLSTGLRVILDLEENLELVEMQRQADETS